MNKRPYPVLAISLLLTLTAIILLTVFTPSCKKLDVNEKLTAFKNRSFFDLSPNAPIVLQKIVAEFERQNKLTGFVKAMVAKEGMPLWERSQIIKSNIPAYNFGGEDSDISEVFTPVLNEDSTEVNGFFYSKVMGDSVELRLYRANDYDLFPHGKVDSAIVTAEMITLKLIELDNTVFGHREYEVIDTSLYLFNKTGQGKTEKISFQLTPDPVNAGRFVFYVVCWETQNCACLKPGASCNPDHPCMNGACDRCYWCIDVKCTTIAMPGGGGGTSWPPDPPISNPPTGGGSGGGTGSPGGGNCTGTSNCGSNGTRIVDGKVPCGGCGPGPVIIITPEPEPPCDPYISHLQNDANFKANFKYLNGSSIFGLGYETGFAVRMGTNLYVQQNGNAGSPLINWLLTGNIDGLLHSHYAGLSSIFSTQDMLFMAQIFLQGGAENEDNFFFGMTSNYGKPMLMKIKNATAFRIFAEKIAGTNGNDMSRQRRFINRHDGKFVSDNPDTNEREFLQMLSKENAIGAISLYRGNDDCDKWTELSLDNLNVVTGTPCY